MAFAVTNTFTNGSTIDADEVNQNFSDVEGIINGGLSNDNLATGAAIANAKLANDDYEVVITETVDYTMLNDIAAGEYWLLGGIPYDAADGTVSYTILGVETAFQSRGGTGGTDAVYTLVYGNSAAETTTVLSANITVAQTATTLTQTRHTLGAGTTCTLDATTPKYFMLKGVTQGVGYDIGDQFMVAIKLKRTNGLRA